MTSRNQNREDGFIVMKVVRELKLKPNIKRLPLDGGWGWMVVLGCSMMHLLVGGLSRSYGVVYIELQNRFNSSASITAWVGGLCIALRMGLSPLGTSLSNRFGTRPVMFTGGLLIGFGCLLSAFTPNTEFMFFSYSIVTGIGGTLAYAPSLVLVSQYFNKYRAIAVGIGSAGSGIGVFGVPPLINAVFDYYGYNGCFIIVGAIMFNICVCGALHRPLEANFPPLDKKAVSAIDDPDLCDPNKELQINVHQETQNKVQNTHIKVDQEVAIAQENEAGLCCSDNIDTVVANVEEDKSTEQLMLKIKDPNITNELHVKATCCENLSKYIDLNLCQNAVFLTFIFGMGFYTMSYMAGQMFIPALGQSRGHSKTHAVFLLSALGISDTVSRVSSGFIFDIPALKPYRSLIFFMTLIIAGSCNFLWAILHSYQGLLFTCILHGLFNGCMVSQRATMIADLFGVETISSSFGLTIFAQGCGIMIGPLAAGLLRDLTGDYMWSYMFTGAMALVGAALFFISSHHHRWPHCHKQQSL